MSRRILLVAAAMLFGLTALGSAGDLGPFTDQLDIGAASTSGPGSATFDSASGALTVSGGGANIWANQDDFHYVWKKASGDIMLAANVSFSPATKGAIEHRKAVIMIRQSLDPDSPYADACVHGNGMTALQWRDTKGGISNEVQANANAPHRLRIEKRGDYFSMSIGDSAADLHPAGGCCKVEISGEYYIGIGVCAHSKDRVESATVSDIEFGVPPTGTGHTMISTLETIALSSGDRKVVYVLGQSGRFEAPNWGADNVLYFNNRGRLYKIKGQLPSSNPSPSNTQAEPEALDLGILKQLNNDHVLSFDKNTLAVSDQSQGNHLSSIWTIPVGGGTPKQITELTPSYCHGWSPDGKTLVYAGKRTNQYDIYAISAEGGEETRLTDTPAHEDGPEYSPDGQYIYFNSDRTGRMQIWRMHTDGSEPEQITKDEDGNNWFPHISPNGQQMVYLTYPPSVEAGAHPESKDVMLHLMELRTGKTKVIAKLFGGQGTINVPSWSPDSKYFAFVSYQSVSN